MGTAAVIGRLVVNVEARIDKLAKGLKAGQSAVGKFAASVGAPVAKAMGIFSAATGASGVVSLGALTASLANTVASIDELNDAAGRIGTTTDALSKLRYAGKMSGVEMGDMDKSLQKMLVNISKAAEGGKEAAETFSEIGLSAKSLRFLAPEEQFYAIGNALGKVTNNADKMRLTMAIFGKGGGGLVNTFEDGATAIGKAADEAERLGLVVSQADADKIADLADAWDRLGATMQGAQNRFWVEWASDLTDALNGLAIALADFKPEAKNPMDKMRAFFQSGAGMPNVQSFWDNVFQNKGNKASGTVTDRERRRIESFNNMPFMGRMDTTASAKKEPTFAAYYKVEGAIVGATEFFMNAAKQADKALYASIEPARQFTETQLKKLQKEEAKQERLKTLAESLKDEFMTPVERYGKQQAAITEAFGRKLITFDIAQAAQHAARADFEKRTSLGPRPELSLLEKGTSEAFSASRRNIRDIDKQSRLLDVGKQTLAVNKEVAEATKFMASVFNDMQLVGVN